MARQTMKNRLESTIIRDNHVHDVYKDVIEELGDLAAVVAKSYIYEKIRARTGLCTRAIAYILNHTRKM